MADPANAICSTTRVKQIIGETGSSYDGQIEGLVGVVSEHVNKWTGCIWRTTATPTEYTEYYDINDHERMSLYTSYRPIISVTSLYEDAGRTYSNALVENTDYLVYTEEARIARIGAYWARGMKSIKIVYKGGYTTQALLAADRYSLAEAAAQWVAWLWYQTHPSGAARLGLTSVSKGDGSITGMSLQPPPHIISMLWPHANRIGL